MENEQAAPADNYKAWYDEAMVASNEAGFVGLSAAETIRALSAQAAPGGLTEEPDPGQDGIFSIKNGEWRMRVGGVLQAAVWDSYTPAWEAYTKARAALAAQRPALSSESIAQRAIDRIIGIIGDYLPPDSGVSEHEAMNRIIACVDPWPPKEPT